MRVGIYQNHPQFGQVASNIEHAIEDLSKQDADLVVLPELFNTGYQFVSREEVETLAEGIPSGKTCQALIEFAKSKNMYLVFGMAETDGNHFYNSAALVGPGGYVGKYRKAHLFAEEKYFFEPGDTGFHVFDVGHARIGVMVCFDWCFPESTRVLALLGADIICHPVNLVLPHGQQAMLTHSLENGVFSATANRIGTEARGGKKPLAFTGKSQIVDALGRIMTKLGEGETGVAVVDIDVEEARNKKITAQNDRLADRRPDLYGPLVQL